MYHSLQYKQDSIIENHNAAVHLLMILCYVGFFIVTGVALSMFIDINEISAFQIFLVIFCIVLCPIVCCSVLGFTLHKVWKPKLGDQYE